MSYHNRQDAGKQLVNVLSQYKGMSVVVLALPRGGVVLGAEVANGLQAPLGLVLVRKIGHPSYAEYAIGAIAEDEAPVYNEQEIRGINKSWLKQAELSARELIQHRRELYYGEDFMPPKVKGKTVIIVDDGIATGLTMEAAALAVRNQHPKQVVVAVPVASQESVDRLKSMVDRVIVLDNPEDFLGAVGAHYQEFNQVNDEAVRALLREVHYDIQQDTTAN
jgi:predicted phosphoribosyltransferase